MKMRLLSCPRKVDPGHQFWFQGKNNEEIVNEARDVERSDAEKRLLKL